MKKSSKILGSIALSAALVMGTAAPAFAFDGSETTDGKINDSDVTGVAIGDAVKNAESTLSGNKSVQDGYSQNDNGASTVINASTYTSQLSVTIPLTLPLKFDTVGGKGMAPSPGTYYIQNNSSTKIAVKQADYKVLDKTMWALGASDFTDSIAEADNKPSAGVKVGDFYLGITPVLATETNGLKTLALKAVNGDKEKGSDNGLNWGINPKQKYGFKLDPSSSKLNMSLDKLEPLASITYTVGVSTAGTKDWAVFVEDNTKKTASDGVDTVTEAKTHVMNKDGLAATFGTNVAYVADPVSGDATNGFTGTAQDVTTGEWEVVAVNYSNLGKYVPYPQDELVNNGTVSYQVVVKAAPAAPAAPVTP